MPKLGTALRRVLYRALPLPTYLRVLSRAYFFGFDRGWLRDNPLYDYPYFLQHVLRAGDVCIDVGANLGYLTVLMSRHVGPGGRVYAVEPVAPVREVLERNTRGRANVEVVPYALGTEDKWIEIGNATVSDRGFMASGSNFVLEDSRAADVTFAAEMRRGSALFAQLKRLDFVKIDIEGYEGVVVPELAPVIDAHRPMLLIEARGQTRAQLIEFFGERGYAAYTLEDGKLAVTTAAGKRDVLFVPPGYAARVGAHLA